MMIKYYLTCEGDSVVTVCPCGLSILKSCAAHGGDVVWRGLSQAEYETPGALFNHMMASVVLAKCAPG